MMALVVGIAMAVGVAFLKEVSDILGSNQGSPFLLIALMFVWDGIFIFMTNDYVTKKELAVGIMLGTLLKTILFIKYYGKTSGIHAFGKAEGKEKGSSR